MGNVNIIEELVSWVKKHAALEYKYNKLTQELITVNNKGKRFKLTKIERYQLN